MGAKFNVAVLDGMPSDYKLLKQHVLDAGGECFNSFGKEQDEIDKASRAAHGVVLSRKAMTREVIESMPNLRVIARTGVGVDHIDRETASERGIIVLNSPSYGTQEVSDYAIGLLMMSARFISPMTRGMRDGKWNWIPPGKVPRMSESTATIIGLGTIGQETARKLGPMVKRVIAYDPYLTKEGAAARHAELVESLEEACASQYVILHAPYVKPDTHHLIGKKEIACMPETGHIVNVARGEVLDLDALVEALDAEKLAGAAVDVFGEENDPPDDPLAIWSHDKVICTPHNAWYSEVARMEMMMEVVRDMVGVLTGDRPFSVTNPEVIKDEPWFDEWADNSIPSVHWQIERLRRLGTLPQ